jgi:hypothetical protein
MTVLFLSQNLPKPWLLLKGYDEVKVKQADFSIDKRFRGFRENPEKRAAHTGWRWRAALARSLRRRHGRGAATGAAAVEPWPGGSCFITFCQGRINISSLNEV